MYVLYLKDENRNIYLVEEDGWHEDFLFAIPFFSFEEAKTKKDKLDKHTKKKDGWNQAVKIKKLTPEEGKSIFEELENSYILLQKRHEETKRKINDLLRSL